MALLNGVYRGPCGIYAQSPTTVSPAAGQQGAGITAYAAWLGKTVTYVLDYVTNTPSSWTQFTNGTLYNPRGAANYTTLNTWGSLGARTMMVGLSPCAGRTTGTGGTTWAAEAAGTNDASWTTLGNNLVTWGYASAYIRLGREFNYPGYNWSPSTTGDTPNQYISGYQHIVTLLKGIAGNSFKFMWNPALSPGTVAGQAHASASYDAQAWYPGDSFVDSIGLDVYDWGNYPSQTAAPWGSRTLAAQQSNWSFLTGAQDGLASWAQFASSHGKQLAFPEWGLQQWLLSSGGSTWYVGGGDDAYYVTQMASFMAANNCLMQAMWEDPGQGVFDADSYAGGTLSRTASMQSPDVSRSTFQFFFGNTNTGTGGTQGTGSGSTGGSPGQGIGSLQPPVPPVVGLGWEIFVRSYADYTTLLCQVPPSVYTTFQAAKMLNDLGSGSVTLNLDAPWWKNTVMGDGSTSNTILDFECLWQISLNGVVRFEFLGETVTEQLVDPSEQRTVTVTGPGTAATLKWGSAMPNGFPAIVLKLDGLADSFGEVSASGSGVLDTNIWNVVNPAGGAYITPVPQAASQAPGVVTGTSGSLTIAATAGTTLLGSTPWDATDTLVSAQIAPVGAQGSATDANGNPVAYGTGLDGSELTQMYVESLKNTAYVAGFGLSATTFYAWFAGSSGPQVHVISSASAYSAASYAHWMITEQGGSGGGPGTFYFWTSPDGSTWTQQWSVAHSWDATYTGFFITAKYDTAGQSVILSSLNSNVTTPSYQGNIFLGQSSMGIWTSLLKTCQARGTIPFISTQLTAAADSFGNAWTDTQNVQVTNGTSLYSLLQSFCATVNADYCMQPGFNLQVGQNIALGGAAVSLGADQSSQVVFREAHDEMAKQRTRVRNQIANQIGLENSDGHEISASSATSIAEWGQREGWFQTSALVDPASMDIAAAAFLAKGDGEVLSWTLSIPPLIPGKTIFENFDVGDWVGLERPDWTAIDAVRVTGIAVQVDPDGVETHELTLVSYLQYLQEQFTYVASKLGGAFVNALGTTPVTPSRFGSGQVPTWFAPAATLAKLADVVGTGGTGGSPLVYNAATGQWQSASSANPAGAGSVPLTLAGSGGSVTISNGAVAVSSAAPAPAIDGGGPVPAAAATTTTTPTGTTVTDSAGTPRVVIGHQSDGTVTVTEINGTAPATPSTPIVSGALSAIVAGWDGLLGGAAPLLDFLWTEVHVSTSSGFTPSSATLQGTMAAGGVFGVGSLLGGTTYFVKLVARNKSRVASPASTQASAVAITPGAGSGAKVTVASTAPSSPATGDLWYDTSNGNRLNQWSGSAWTAYQYGANAIATGSITSTQISSTAAILGSQLSASAAITGSQLAAAAGITGTQLSSSAGITGTQLAANTITVSQLAGTVTARALGGITTTIATTAPSSPATGDLWVNTTTGVIEQWSGSAWVIVTFNAANAIQAGTITATQILANTITATQLAAGAVTTSVLAANAVTAAKIAAGTITATQIAAGTITASLLAAGIVVAGIVDATSITGSTIQNSSSNPRTSINPDGSVTITNSSGTVIFKIGPDGTTYWYNSSGALLMELQPGGNDLIYASATGPSGWDFEGSTNSWAGTNATLASSSSWSIAGVDSLSITHSNTSQPWGAHSPAFAVVAGTTASMTGTVFTAAIVTGVSVGFTFWSGAGGTGSNLGSVSGDQGTFTTAASGTYQVTVTGATVPLAAVSATFFVQSTMTTISATMNVDAVSVAGGLVYSNSPTGGTDSFGNPFEQGINFVGLPALTNVFGVEDPYGSQLATIDGSGNISGQTVSAATDLVVGGDSLLSTLLPAKATGGVAYGYIPSSGYASGNWPSSGGITTTETPLFWISAAVIPGHTYLIMLANCRVGQSASAGFRARLRGTTNGTTPSTSSDVIAGWFGMPDSGNLVSTPSITQPWTCPAGVTMLNVLFTGQTASGTAQLTQFAQTTFLNFNNMVAVTDIGAGIAGNSFTNASSGGGGGTGGGTFTTSWNATSSHSYYGSAVGNGLRNTNGSMFQGTYSGGDAVDGDQYSFMSWPSAVQTALSGTTINWVKLQLTNQHSWYNSGMYVVLGYANFTTFGGTGNLTGASENVTSYFINEGQTLTVTLPGAFGTALASGAAKCFLLGPSSSTSGGADDLYNYGYFAGGSSPVLTANYTV